MCTETDQNEMRYRERFKTILLNEKLIHITVKDEYEERLMDKEQIQLASRMEIDDPQGDSRTQHGLTLYESRKINEQNTNEMKLRMHEHIRKKT